MIQSRWARARHVRCFATLTERTDPVTTVLEKLTEQETQRKATATEQYARFVEALADGIDADPADVRFAMSEAGRTTDDLADDVERFRHRRKLADEVQAGRGLERELHGIEEQIAKLQEDFAKIRRAHEDSVGSLATRRRRLHEIIAQAHAAARELREGVSPEVQAEVRSREQKLARLADRIRQQRRHVAHLQTLVAEQDALLERNAIDPRKAREKIAELTQGVVAAKTTLASMEDEEQLLAADLEQFQAEDMLRP